MHNSSSTAVSVTLVLVAVAVLTIPAAAQSDRFDAPSQAPSDRPRANRPPSPVAPPDGGVVDPGDSGLDRLKKSLKDGSRNGKSAEGSKEAKPIPRSLRRPGSPAFPEGGSQRAALLSELYAYLATATDEDVAKRTAHAIEQVWHSANSDTVNLLMDRASKAAKAKQGPLAIKLFEQATQLAPDNPEVFSSRALVHYGQGDLERAMGDLRRALALDPNHYRSLDNLAQILKELDRKKAALEVYRRLYAVHPYFSGAKSALDELEREVEGKPS